MAGHSKWANIKHKKAVQDAKRGKMFTKIIKELMISARDGGSDPESNPRLRQAIVTAKAANMPNDTLKRAIQKGAGELEGVDYEEFIYEGYGPGGIAIIMEVMTDNKNRTVAEIRHLMNKYGGSLGENGSVSWMFEKAGQVIISNEGLDENIVLDDVLSMGAIDFLSRNSEFIISTEPSDLARISDEIDEKNYKIILSKIEMLPKSWVKISGEELNKVLVLMDHLEEQDDIQNLYANFEFDEDFE